jgi:uncharacterized protein YndB with AHSA1/START domain
MSKINKALVITHWVGATPDVLWNAYSTPELFHQFFSPEGLSIPLESVVMEFHVGGRFEFDMVFEESGEVSPNRGIILELEAPHKMVFGEPEFMGGELRSTQTFTADNGGTLIVVTQEGLPEELIDNPEVLEAFRSSFRKLGRVLGVNTENR